MYHTEISFLQWFIDWISDRGGADGDLLALPHKDWISIRVKRGTARWKGRNESSDMQAWV
jgi:hypothetical protein